MKAVTPEEEGKKRREFVEGVKGGILEAVARSNGGMGRGLVAV